MENNQVPLNEFITLQRGFDLPKNDRIEGKIPVVASTGVGGYHNESRVLAPGVVIGRSGSIGGGQYIEEDFWPLNTTLWVKDFKGHNPRFVYYLLKSIDFSMFNVGSGVPTLNRNHLNSLLVNELERNIEDSVAVVLGNLDDKIKLLAQTNQTLEQMAQALFKSWFVDFDPVIDNALAAGNDIPESLQQKAEQRAIYQEKAQQLPDFKPLPDDIRALFPSEFEQTDEPSIGIAGWVPKGWMAGNFENLMVLQRGFDLPKTKRADGPYPLIAASGQDGTHNEFKVVGPGVTTGRSGKLGEVTFAHDNFWPLNTTLWVKEYLLSNPYHAYFFLNTLPLEEFNAGSAVPTLNRNHVHGHRSLLPEKRVASLFETTVKKWFEKLNKNQNSIKHLNALKDALLPKLISGEISLNQDVA